MKGVVVVCGVGFLAMTACSRPQAEAGVTADAPTVAVAKVSRRDLSQTLTVVAEFRPFQEIDVHAKVAGYVKSILVDVGDRVRPGQLLAVLEVPELKDELQQDEAAVRRSSEEVNRAQADLERNDSAHQVSHLASTRLLAVSKERPTLIAQQDLDEATGRDHEAEAQVSTARAALAAAREQLEVAKANQAKTKTLFDYARITAPFEGIITHRYADTGAMIQAGTSSQTQAMPLVKLSQNSLLRLIIPAPESAVSRIRVKEPVDVRVQSLGRTFPGTVSRFADRVDAETRTMRVEVDVPNTKLELVPGMYAEATIALEQAKDTLTVPIQAIDRDGNRAHVLIVNGDRKLEQREVGTGLESADRVAIVTGLREGDLVVLGSRAQLKVGAVVVPKEVPVGGGEGSR